MGCWGMAALFALSGARTEHRGSLDVSLLGQLFDGISTLMVGFGGGGLLGGIIGGITGAMVDRLEAQVTDRRVHRLVGALAGALLGMLAIALLQAWQAGNIPARGLIGGLEYTGFWSVALPVQYLIGALPGIVCGIIGTRPQTTTTATCSACGGALRPDATSCNHCKATFAPAPGSTPDR